jgi:PAP2 superfamily protein
VIRRIAFIATAAGLMLSFAMAAIASGRGDRHGPGQVHLRTVSSTTDQVVQWNQELQKVLAVPGAQPTSIHPTRTMAITQIAVYDAVNGIVGGGRPLAVDLRGPHDASADAAVAAAARTSLDRLLPTQQPTVDAFFEASLAQIGSGPSVKRGIRFGDKVASAVLAARANDGAATTPPVFTPHTGPGEYQPTPPAFAPAAFTQTSHVQPFVLKRADQFRPAAPPALSSPKYATDFSEVEALGELNSATRTSDQTTIGTFWGAAPIWIVWNQIADQAGTRFRDSLAQNARLFAMLDTTLADGAIALYDAKYAYHRWRPITAITAPDQGNANTAADPNWVPLANTANDPSYPGAHATFSQAAATVLEDFFGTDVFPFSLTNPSLGITRTFTSFSQASNEASASRIFAGQHFRYDEEAGQTLGAQVADFVADHTQPHPRHHRR